MKQEKIIDAIKQHDIISFDVFDTLLVRPYAKPTDLFYHMEKCLNIPSFARARIFAEQRARKNTTKSEITLDDIYDEIDDKFKKFKQSELDWEYMVLRPNPDILSIWAVAHKLGKRIIIASDMYLPKNFISDVLIKNGFTEFDKIYVSSDLNKTKSNGGMFDVIIHDTHALPNKILHIGDNVVGDYKIPMRKGISAIKIIPIINQYIKSGPRVAKFWKSRHNSLDASILTSLLAIYSKTSNTENNYWSKIGYEYAGPVIYGYTR